MNVDTTEQELEEILRPIVSDPAIIGAVLSGSQARIGMATNFSDYDVYVITDGEPARGSSDRSARLDVTAMSLDAFRDYASFGSEKVWDRYSFAYARVLKDRSDGLIAQLVAEKGRLSEAQAQAKGAGCLDALINQIYRWLKNHRDGQVVEARLDAAEAVNYLVTFIFAVHGRVRPFNKYLGWELRTHPLGDAMFDANQLLPRLEEVLAEAHPDAAHKMFRDVEALARAAGHGNVLDRWGETLTLMRGVGG
jgi:predicted nucleotidyltransferase